MSNYFIKKTETKTIIGWAKDGVVEAIEAPRKSGKPRFTKSRIRTIPAGAVTHNPSTFQRNAMDRILGSI